MNSYKNLPFCHGTSAEFYTYTDQKDIAAKSYMHMNEVLKCRTIGILQSLNGKFYLSDIDSPNNILEPRVQVSMVYLKVPPQSTVIPYPVQVFGALQWKNRPVIFVNILQVMTVPMAIRIRNALSNITNRHLAISGSTEEEEVIAIP